MPLIEVTESEARWLMEEREIRKSEEERLLFKQQAKKAECLRIAYVFKKLVHCYVKYIEIYPSLNIAMATTERLDTSIPDFGNMIKTVFGFGRWTQAVDLEVKPVKEEDRFNHWIYACPICGHTFNSKTVRDELYHSRELDFIYYDGPQPQPKEKIDKLLSIRNSLPNFRWQPKLCYSCEHWDMNIKRYGNFHRDPEAWRQAMFRLSHPHLNITKAKALYMKQQQRMNKICRQSMSDGAKSFFTSMAAAAAITKK